jgi:murein DD-endopeptidase MepM/ murein hydrolase activator NlpD
MTALSLAPPSFAPRYNPLLAHGPIERFPYRFDPVGELFSASHEAYKSLKQRLKAGIAAIGPELKTAAPIVSAGVAAILAAKLLFALAAMSVTHPAATIELPTVTQNSAQVVMVTPAAKAVHFQFQDLPSLAQTAAAASSAPVAFQSLSPDLQKDLTSSNRRLEARAAKSHNLKLWEHAYEEAGAQLLHNHHHAAREAGKQLIRTGAELAEQNNLTDVNAKLLRMGRAFIDHLPAPVFANNEVGPTAQTIPLGESFALPSAATPKLHVLKLDIKPFKITVPEIKLPPITVPADKPAETKTTVLKPTVVVPSNPNLVTAQAFDKKPSSFLIGRLSSVFGWRSRPRREMHAGLDFSAPKGQPIYATTEGDVEVVGKNVRGVRGFGNCLKIKISDSVKNLYGHLDHFVSGLHVGMHINRGQLIGYVGDTGHSTGNHVHYGMYLDGKPVDPLKYYTSSNDIQQALFTPKAYSAPVRGGQAVSATTSAIAATM